MPLQTRNACIAAQYEKGDPIGKLAEAHGLAAKTVRNIVSCLGANRKGHIAGVRSAIAQRIQSGAKPADAAKEFGVTVNWARKVAKSRNAMDSWLTLPEQDRSKTMIQAQ